MTIPAKPTITPPPASLPTRGENPTDFSNKINALVQWYPDLTTTLQDSVDWSDAVYTAMETEADNAAASASASAASATDAAGVSALDGFVGRWADQTGAASIPTAVYHSGTYWVLMADIADITASEPGVTSDWEEAKGKTLWVAISTSQTLVVNTLYAVDFTTGPLTLTLPATPAQNDFAEIYKSAGEIIDSIIGRNGETIMGLAENLTIDYEATSLYMVYNGADWRIVR